MPEPKIVDHLKLARANLVIPPQSRMTLEQFAGNAAAAQAHATIALAEQTAALVEQQRVGNLIAASRSGWAWETVEELDDAQARIREAVGLPKVEGLRERIVQAIVSEGEGLFKAVDHDIEAYARAVVFGA